MKGFIRKITVLLTAFILVTNSYVTSFAESKVSYEGKAERFIFKPGSDTSPTDLFENFKNVMPGDKLTQKITVKNNASDKVNVKIYIRSLGAKPGSEEFLSKLNMTVSKSKDNEMAYMFDATAEKTDGMKDWVLLGTLYSGGEVNLDVTLQVPVTMDNNFQKAAGYLDWQFKVEEIPVKSTDPKPPKTADKGNIITWSATGLVSLGLIILLELSRKKTIDK